MSDWAVHWWAGGVLCVCKIKYAPSRIYGLYLRIKVLLKNKPTIEFLSFLPIDANNSDGRVRSWVWRPGAEWSLWHSQLCCREGRPEGCSYGSPQSLLAVFCLHTACPLTLSEIPLELGASTWVGDRMTSASLKGSLSSAKSLWHCSPALCLSYKSIRGGEKMERVGQDFTLQGPRPSSWPGPSTCKGCGVWGLCSLRTLAGTVVPSPSLTESGGCCG